MATLADTPTVCVLVPVIQSSVSGVVKAGSSVGQQSYQSCDTGRSRLDHGRIAEP